MPSLPITPALIQWLANGQRGMSSNVIFTHMTGIDADQFDKTFHPRDPADMRRCLKLLDIGGETWRAQIPTLATISAGWAKVVERWAILEDITRKWVPTGSFPGDGSWEKWQAAIAAPPP